MAGSIDRVRVVASGEEKALTPPHHGFYLPGMVPYVPIPSSAITFFMSAHTSFFAAGFRRR